MCRKELFRTIADDLSGIMPADEAEGTAWWVLEELTGMSRTELLLWRGELEAAGLDDVLLRLHAGEPVQYIFGHTVWRGLDLLLNKSTLIPRPETAELVEWVLHDHPVGRRLRVLDAGTGSGCIAIAVKKERPEWDVTGIDISADALRIAEGNGQRNGVAARWRQADMTEEGKWQAEKWDIVISNPPYVRECEKVTMRSAVLDYEPHRALFVPDYDPLLFYRAMAKRLRTKEIYLEVNEALAAETEALLREYGYADTAVRKDSYGKQRMVRGRMVCQGSALLCGSGALRQ